MTNPASDSSEVAVFGQYAFIASKGIDRWRADLSQMAFKLLTAFPLDEKQSQISRSLLEELEKNSLGCHRLEKEAEIASNRHLFHFLNQLDWVSDTQSHLLPPDRSLEFLELREEIVQRLANEATIECAPQAIGADASTISIPCTKYRIPGSEGIVCEILRHQCSLAGRSLSDRAFIGIGYSGSVPKHWNTVQNIYFESRLNNGFDEVGLESLLLARDSYLKSGTALAILAIIQCAEMSCKELGERDERPAYRQAIDAGERILESECGLRRIGLRRWHTMPVGDKYSNYRIQYVQIPGRGRELVVRILSPAYENIKDGVCNNLGLVQITS